MKPARPDTSRPATPDQGIDRLLADPRTCRRLAAQRTGLLTNHACMTAQGDPTARALARRLAAFPGPGLMRLLAAEHAVTLQRGAGEGVEDGADPLTGLPVASLYGRGALPDDATLDAALAGLDTVVIDLRDVGVRCYTYAASAAILADAALARGISVVICDRDNPLGPATAGPRPDAPPAGAPRPLLCFFDVPFVHGDRLAALVMRHLGPARADAVTVFPAEPAGPPPLAWCGPSPALAHPVSVALYPGLVLLEGTNVSEGRHTSHAFRSVSADGLDAPRLADAVNGWRTGFRASHGRVVETAGMAPAVSRPAVFLDPAGKARRDPFALGLRLLDWLHRHHPGFAWTTGAGGVATLDILTGTASVRQRIEAGLPDED